MKHKRQQPFGIGFGTLNPVTPQVCRQRLQRLRNTHRKENSDAVRNHRRRFPSFLPSYASRWHHTISGTTFDHYPTARHPFRTPSSTTRYTENTRNIQPKHLENGLKTHKTPLRNARKQRNAQKPQTAVCHARFERHAGTNYETTFSTKPALIAFTATQTRRTCPFGSLIFTRCRFGLKMRGHFFVTCVPIPPLFFD